MIIAEKIIFSIIAFSLFVIMFFKMIRRNDNIYIAVLVAQALGIALNFIEIIFSLNFNMVVKGAIYFVSIILPIYIIVTEAKKKIFAERVKLLIARIALNLNNTKLAKKILLELAKKYPESYGTHRYLAEVYEKEGGMRKAIDEYVRAVDLNKKDYDSYYRISFLLNELGKKDDAKVMLQNLLSKKPDYLNATILLGDIYCDIGEYKEALNTYASGLRYAPNDYNLLYSMGMAYTLLNDFKNAKICYEKAAIINNLLFNAYYNIAQINFISNDLEEAEKYFTKALDDEDLEADAYYHLGKIYMLRGDYDNAVKFVNLSIQLDKTYIKIAMKEPLFIPVASKFDFPIIDDEDIVEKKKNLTPNEERVRVHLEKTFKVVDMLSITKNRMPRQKKKEEKDKANEREQ
mgnify:FL=1